MLNVAKDLLVSIGIHEMEASALVSEVEKRMGSCCVPNVEILCEQTINFNPS